jgi:mortality factor 4-like protein 1
MAPKNTPQPPFQKDERVLCFHHEMLYEAKILDIMDAENGEGWQYKIHYKGWKSSWDDWVPQDRVRKFTQENKELAANLVAQMKMLQSGKSAKQSAKKAGVASAGGRGVANGSDMSSARGSEERTAGAATTSGRGPRRTRDYELEQVRWSDVLVVCVCVAKCCISGGISLPLLCFYRLGLSTLRTCGASAPIVSLFKSLYDAAGDALHVNRHCRHRRQCLKPLSNWAVPENRQQHPLCHAHGPIVVDLMQPFTIHL